MFVPKGMVGFVILLALGFLISMTGALRDKTRAKPHQKVSGVPAADGSETTPLVSYQNAAEDGGQPKQITYCVIDGRLVDS